MKKTTQKIAVLIIVFSLNLLLINPLIVLAEEATPTFLIVTTAEDFNKGYSSGTTVTDVGSGDGSVTNSSSSATTDQSQTSGTTKEDFDNGEGQWLAQTFTSTTSGLLNNVILSLDRNNSSNVDGDITLELRKTSTFEIPSTNIIASSSVKATMLNKKGQQDVSFNFPIPPALEQEITYALVLYRSGSGNTSANYNWYRSSAAGNNNPYPNGSGFTSSDSGASWTQRNKGNGDHVFTLLASRYTTTGKQTSDVLDTVYPTTVFSTLSWNETLPSLTDITFEIRASNSAFSKDNTTLPWISLETKNSPIDLSETLPDLYRYFQWQAILNGSASATPTLKDVTVEYTITGSISGKKFNDLDADGTDDNGNDPDLGGWIIFLDSNDNGILDAGETSTISDTNGFYSFARLTPGIYHVKGVSQANWQQTTAAPSAITVTSGSDISDINFGSVRFQELQDAKFAATSGNSSSTSSVLVLNESTINVSGNEGAHAIFLPLNTIITRSDGEIMNISQLTTQTVTTNSLSGLGSGVVVDGALQWGITNVGLTFSTPITLHIFVGASLNGQTLNVKRSITPNGPWFGVEDGIVAPDTCVVGAVTSGVCTFQATKASYYATTRTITTSSPTTSSSDGTGDGMSDGLGCGSHDCSGGSAAPEAQVLGALTQLAMAAGFTPEVLGDKTPTEEEKTKEVKGGEEKGILGDFTKEPKSTSPSNNILLGGAVIIILLAGAFIFLSRRKVS